MTDTKRFLKWLWQCAGKNAPRPVHYTFNVAFFGFMAANIIRDSGILRRGVEEGQDEHEESQLANERKVDLGISQQLEARRAQKRSIEPCDVPCPSRKEADVD